MFRKAISTKGNLIKLLESIEAGEKVSVFGLGKTEKLSFISNTDCFSLFVATDRKEADEFYEILTAMKVKCDLLVDIPKPNLADISSDLLKLKRIAIKLEKNELEALIITPQVLLHKIINKKRISSCALTLKEGDEIDVQKIALQLIQLGYVRTSESVGVGQFNLKGEILDIFPICSDYPIRIMLDFETIESIKYYDTVTLLPIKEIKKIKIYSYNYLEYENDSVIKYLNKFSTKSNKTKELVEKAISDITESRDRNNFWFFPFETDQMNYIFECIPDFSTIYFSDAKIVYDKVQEEIKEYNSFITNGIKDEILLPIHESLKLNEKTTLTFPSNLGLVAFQHLSNANRLFSPNKIFSFKCLPVTDYINNKNLLIMDLKQYSNKTILLFVRSNENVKKFSDLLENKLQFFIANTISQVVLNEINILPISYPISFSFLEENLVVIGDLNLVGKKKIVKENVEEFVDNNFLPEKDTFVVHNVHGIGKCLGIETLNISNIKKDYVVIEYKNADKLFLPVENMDSIARYVGGDKAPTLNKIGGGEFEKIKQNVKAGLKKLALDLTKLYADREKLKGYLYPPDDELQYEFEKSFGYDETFDQMQAIDTIKKEMQSGKVVDRLICGDVGFGKTEVALRIAFKTILSGKNVIMLAPTTILSEQHYNTCFSRFKNFGVSVSVLNRFKTKNESDAIIHKCEMGEINLLIGTHKILKNNIMLKNLGLIILDEEQKFGVEDKEKLKLLKKNVNVLTLSATPIPRTLHMATVGIRDISILHTPPKQRLSIIMQVTEFSFELIKNVVQREIERAGQVLIIYNRVESIYNFAGKVRAVLGANISVDIAHGQMEEKNLEDAIYKLYNNETQVLISTTLIENGVDLPNANSIIIVNADMLGLSQLYQLKGRIGRSDRQAYAYFTYDGNKMLTDVAYKRLEAINEYSALGSGYKIALKDLEIRGAGNIFGAEQHGHMEKVGYALYVELLNQAVKEVKGEINLNKSDVRVETLIEAILPQDYIENYTQRMATYYEIAKISNMEEMKNICFKLKEVYGDLPEEVINLCKISLIKNLTSIIGGAKVSIKKNNSIIEFDGAVKLPSSSIVSAVDNFSNAIINMEGNLCIVFTNYGDAKQATDLLINFLEYAISN